MVDKYYKAGWEKRSIELAEKGILDDSQSAALQSMIASPDQENFVLAEELLRLKVSEALVTGLNDGQTKAFLEIVNYFREDDFDGVVLKGYAGTGKTYLVKRIIEYITTAYSNRKIAITAPTNKAVHVLAKNSPFSDKTAIFEGYGSPETKITYCTIHKLLGLKEEISNTGVQKFVAGDKDVDITKYTYLIVDEVSMLSDDLFIQLMKFKGKVKFIFMGDPCQIPPINREHCLPFTERIPFNLLKLELNEIMRQKGNHPIVDASMVIRNALTAVQPIPQLKSILNAENNGLIYINAKTERDKVKPLINRYFFDDKFQKDADFVKIIAWRNKTVDYLNSVVRGTIFGPNCAMPYIAGDKILANKALFSREHSKWGDMMYVIKANTSDEFTVRSVTTVTKSFKERVKRSPEVNFTGKFWELSVGAVSFKDPGLKLYVMHEDSIAEFNSILDEVKNMAKKHRIADYWILYYNMLKWSDDITYNYAITAHKS